jgi:hypothetical protein
MCAINARASTPERRSFTDTCGVFCLTFLGRVLLSHVSLHQFGKLQEIGQPEQRTTPADDHLWIGGDDVGPLPRYRADVIVVDAQ